MPIRPVVATLAAALVAALAAALVAAFTVGCSLAQAPLGPDEIVAAFISESQDEARTFHMEWQGTMSTTMSWPDTPPGQEITGSINASFDFSGDDFAGAMTTRTGFLGLPGGQTDPFGSTTAYARVRGVFFVRYTQSGWERMEANWQGQSEFDPLHGLAAEGVVYEAGETIDSVVLHRLRVVDPGSALNASLFSGSAELTPDDVSEFLIYVDPQGVPVRAQLRLSGQVALGVDLGDFIPPATYQLSFDYVFTAWGEDFYISPPT